MHLEVLVEDASGAITVEAFLKMIFANCQESHTYRMHQYRGIGDLPKNLRGSTDPHKRILLDRLPKILRGYGRCRLHNTAVLVVVDLDFRNCRKFKEELVSVLTACNPRPKTLFRIAIEETESWLLGDRIALKSAYPHADDNVLDSYIQDSICGTWEKLADAIYEGGATALIKLGYPTIGQKKCEWADSITKHGDLKRNQSESFKIFHVGIIRLIDNLGAN